MAEKPKLYYFNARGRMEPVRWLLAAAGVEFEEEFFQSPEELQNMVKSGKLMYEQVPMVEIDGMYLVQSRAIIRYIATKYNLYGKDLKEQTLIDMYVEGMRDLYELIMLFPFTLPHEKGESLSFILDKATGRYLPAFEKVLKDEGKNYLVGNQLSCADVQMFELILMLEELKPDILSAFPKLKEYKARISKLPRIQKFLQPGSQRKGPMDEKTFENAKNIFKIERGLLIKNKATIVNEF